MRGALVAAVALLAACGADRTAGPQAIVEFPDAAPGDVIALRASEDAPTVVEWIERRAGAIRAVSIDGGDITTIATVDVGTDGEQRGLLGHTVVDGIRYAAWTEPDSNHLVVGALGPPDGSSPGTVDRLVWDGGGTAGGAVGGHLSRTTGGLLVLGIGQRTAWAQDHGSGAMVTLDPGGPADQEPVVLSDGYTNPFAFTVTSTGELWVADNAVGDDIERIGRGDLADRDDHPESDVEPRAPSAVVALDGDELAVCGYLDAELRRWDIEATSYGDPLGPCHTGVTMLGDGTIVTATDDALVALP